MLRVLQGRLRERADEPAPAKVETYKLGAELGMCWGGGVDVLVEEIAAAVPTLRVGAGLGLVSSLALIARFLPAFLRTKKVMPAGAVVAVGAWVVLVCALALAH